MADETDHAPNEEPRRYCDEALRANGGDEEGPEHEADARTKRKVDILARKAREAVSLFHAPDMTAYASVLINGHRETWPVRSTTFKLLLVRLFYEATNAPPEAEIVRMVLALLEAQARFDGPEEPVYVRVAARGDAIYIDLADADWRAVEITPYGWQVVRDPPVRFRRAAGMLALPEPQRGGSVEMLRSFVNIANDNDFVLLVMVLAMALRGRGPFPVIAFVGEQGSAKSTATRMVRELVDPSSAALRTLPRDDRDLFIAASNGYVLAFDNLSGLSAWVSDSLCRLATGGGFATRTLYTDSDETIFDAMRPIVLNGIEDFIQRPDLADRAVVLTLRPIPEQSRRPEDELLGDFALDRPLILGALLDLVVHGLRHLPNVKLDRHPRMADFARWGTACEAAAGWPAGSFMAAYQANHEELVAVVLEQDPVANAVRTLMSTRPNWSGTTKQLLALLSGLTTERTTRSKAWPQSEDALGRRLRRAATFLRRVGIEVSWEREATKERTRTVHIAWREYRE